HWCMPGAVPNGGGTDNLKPLGEAGNTARLHLEAAGTTLPDAQASVAVNSLGLLDLVQVSAEGLAPKSPVPGVSRGFQPPAVRKTRGFGNFENQSRRSRVCSGD